MTQWLAKARARISRGVWGHVPRKMFPMLPAKTSFPDKSLVSVTHKQNIFGAKHIYIYRVLSRIYRLGEKSRVAKLPRGFGGMHIL